jgi:hypothetical protein
VTAGTSGRGGWAGFGGQATAVMLAMPLAITVAGVAGLAVTGGGRNPSAAAFLGVFMLAFAVVLGAVPALLAAATLRSWRNASGASPYLAATLFSVAMLAAWGLLAALEPALAPDRRGLLLAAVHPMAGLLFGLFALLSARRWAPALFAGATGLLASAVGLLLQAPYSALPVAAASTLAALTLGLGAFAGAWAYSASEPRPPQAPIPAVPA